MLSALLAQQPSLFDAERITLVDRGLTRLDALPSRFATVKVRSCGCPCMP